MKTSQMKMRADSFDPGFALEAIGGDRFHPNYSPQNSVTMMNALRLERPEPRDYAAVHRLASEQIGGALATCEEIERVDSLTDAAIWVVRRRGEVAGFLAPLALTIEGRNALVDGSFKAGAIEQRWVARMGQPLAGFYCWSYAGKDQFTRGALVLALRSLIDTSFPDLPFFGRDTTEAGARIMGHLGFYPYEATPHLFWRCASVMSSMRGDAQ